MVRFGKRLQAHAATEGAQLPSGFYVDYKSLKGSIKSGVCTEDDFQELYNAELQKFVQNLEEGLKSDPKFVEMNRLALDNILKKWDKHAKCSNVSLRKRNRARVPLVNKYSEDGQRLHGWVYDAELTTKVFSELDADGNGCIKGVSELQEGLRRMNVPLSREAAAALLDEADLDQDGEVSAVDFQRFVRVREVEIWETFQSMDTNNDGLLTHADVLKAFKVLDIPATDAELASMVSTMMHRVAGPHRAGGGPKRSSSRSSSSNGGGKVRGGLAAAADEVVLDYGDLRQLMLLLPASANTRDVLDHWIKAADVDFDFQLPPAVGGSKRSKRDTPLVVMFAGAVAGTISRTATAPMDRLKVLMQVDNGATRQYSSIFDGFRQIYREGAYSELRHASLGTSSGPVLEEGWKKIHRGEYRPQPWRRRFSGTMAFFRGNGANCIKVAPEMAIKFTTYDYYKQMVCVDPEREQMHERFMAGGLAGMTAQAWIYPLEIVKTRLAVAPRGMYKGVSHCMFRVARIEGVRGLYRGLGASLCGIVPYAATDMGVFFTLKENLHSYPPPWEKRRSPQAEYDPGVATLLACGAFSSTCGMLVSVRGMRICFFTCFLQLFSCLPGLFLSILLTWGVGYADYEWGLRVCALLLPFLFWFVAWRWTAVSAAASAFALAGARARGNATVQRNCRCSQADCGTRRCFWTVPWAGPKHDEGAAGYIDLVRGVRDGQEKFPMNVSCLPSLCPYCCWCQLVSQKQVVSRLHPCCPSDTRHFSFFTCVRNNTIAQQYYPEANLPKILRADPWVE